jgi:hypothetical protein
VTPEKEARYLLLTLINRASKLDVGKERQILCTECDTGKGSQICFSKNKL